MLRIRSARRRSLTALLPGLCLMGTLPLPGLPLELTNPSAERPLAGETQSLVTAPIPGWKGSGQRHKGGTDFGNGAWCLSFGPGQELSTVTAEPIRAGASYSLRLDAALLASPNALLVGGNSRNGNFNNGQGGADSRSFANTNHWTRLKPGHGLHADQKMEATRNKPGNLLVDGSRNAALSAEPGTRLFGLNTGHRLQGDERLQLRYQWRPAAAWDLGSDRVAVRFFTTENDKIGGKRQLIDSKLSAVATTRNWLDEAASIETFDARHHGKLLFVLIEGVDGNGDQRGFARLDNFQLGLGEGGPSKASAFRIDFYASGESSPLYSQRIVHHDGAQGQWDHYHVALPAGTLDAADGKSLQIRLSSEDTEGKFVHGIDNLRFEQWVQAGNGAFSDDWDALPDQTFAGPGYWANRTQDWEVKDGAVRCLRPEPYRTLHRTQTSLRGDGQDFHFSLQTRLHAGESKGNALVGFLLGAGPNLEWDAALLVHRSPGRDFGLALGLDKQGRATIQDLGRGEIQVLANGKVPAGGFPKTAKLALAGLYQREDRSYQLKLQVFNEAGEAVSEAVASVPSSRLLGSLGILNHPGPGKALFAFDDFAGKGGALEDHPERHLAIIGTTYTLSRGSLRLQAQLAPVHVTKSGKAWLEFKRDGAWQKIAEAPIDNTDNTSSYTARFTLPDYDASQAVSYRVGIQQGGKPYYWEGTIQREPIEKEELVIAGTNCQRLLDGYLDPNFDWTPRKVWTPHAQLYEQLVKHEPDVFLALGDQIYEAQPTVIDKLNPHALQHDYLWKYYLWMLQARDVMKDLPSVVIPDDHDIFQGNIFGEGGRFTTSENEGGYKFPPEWVNMVQRTMCGNLPDADPYSAIQPAAPVEQDIEVYFTRIVYGRVGMAVLEDRKFKTGFVKAPPKEEQVLLGKRQHDFLEAWSQDWAGQDIKFFVSQTPFATLITHWGGQQNFAINGKDANGWPGHRRNEAWRILRKASHFQVAGDQHLSTVAHHGADAPRDAGYSFAMPAVANFFARVWDPVHNRKGRASKVSPYKGDFYFDGSGTLPDGVTPNLKSDNPHHFAVLAAANPVDYYGKSRGIDPLRLHDQAAGYGITRINKQSRQITFEAWPVFADPMDPSTGTMYPDWPITFSQFDNDGRKPAGYLPEIKSKTTNPVVTVIDESSGELISSIRIQGKTHRPAIFDTSKSYRVEIYEGDASSPSLSLPSQRAE